MNKHQGLFAKHQAKRKNSNGQKILIAAAAGATIVASGSTDKPVLKIGTVNDDVITLAAKSVGAVDALAGDDKITGGDLADFIRGNAGADIIDGGAGVDNIVVIGITSNAGYTLSDIQNPNGTGIDLSVLLNLNAVNNNAVSDISDGEVIDGGVDGARLFVYGVVDFTNSTLKNITRIDVQSKVTFSATQLKELIDSGKLEALIGDGTTEIIITNDGSAVELDFSGIDMQDVKQITVAANATLLLDQDDLRGITAINGGGTIKGLSGILDLNGVTVDPAIAVGGKIIDLTADTADVSHTTATSQVNATNYATEYNDTITASALDMANSQINGLDGDDTLTITGGAGANDFDGITSEIINVENIIFDASSQTSGNLTIDTGSFSGVDFTVKTTAAAALRTIDADGLTDGAKLILQGAGDASVSLAAGDLDATGHSGNNTVTTSGGTSEIKLGDGDNIVEIKGDAVTTITLGDGSETIKWIDGTDDAVNNAGRAIISGFTTGDDKLQFDSSGLNGVSPGMSGAIPADPVDISDYHVGGLASVAPNNAYGVLLVNDQAYADFGTFEAALDAVSVTNGAAGIVGFLNSTSGHFELYIDRTLGSDNNIKAGDFLASFTDITDVADIITSFSNTDFIFIA